MTADECVEHLLMACEGLADALMMIATEVVGPVGRARVRAALAHLVEARKGIEHAEAAQ